MVDLFDWEEQKAEINLSWSSIEGFEELNKLPKDNNEPEKILAEWYNVSSENIVIVHGAQEGMFLTYLALKPNKVVIPLPSYPPIFEQAQALGIKIEYSEIKPKVEKSIIALANPNNPTGLYLNPDEIVSNNLVIIDEIFKYFIDDKPYFHDNAIIISGTSKFFAIRGRKVGWIIAKKELAEKIKKIKDLVTPEPLYEKELIKYIFKNFDFFKERSINIIKENMKILYQFSDTRFKIIHNPYMPVALLTKDALNSMDFCRKLLKETGVLFTPSKFFGIDGGFRVSLGSKDPSILKESLIRLKNFSDKFFG
ncbi:MAG: pyridoxal phosphate-dependent aminotransferase [Thermoprotei archaeon]